MEEPTELCERVALLEKRMAELEHIVRPTPEEQKRQALLRDIEYLKWAINQQESFEKEALSIPLSEFYPEAERQRVSGWFQGHCCYYQSLLQKCKEELQCTSAENPVTDHQS